LLLTGCGSLKWMRPDPILIRPVYPDGSFKCQKAPAVPGDEAGDTEVAVFMALTWSAWKDCHDRLEGLGRDLQNLEDAGNT
jgi:hypothetical protein